MAVFMPLQICLQNIPQTSYVNQNQRMKTHETKYTDNTLEKPPVFSFLVFSLYLQFCDPSLHNGGEPGEVEFMVIFRHSFMNNCLCLYGQTNLTFLRHATHFTPAGKLHPFRASENTCALESFPGKMCDEQATVIYQGLHWRRAVLICSWRSIRVPLEGTARVEGCVLN